MLKVGLTGGFATGKTFVAEQLAQLGCNVIYADKLGHEVLAPGGAAHEAVLDLFGTADRKQLAHIVFNDPNKLAQLTGIVHPAVFELEERLIAATDPNGIAVVEAAILIEAGRAPAFDRIILTTCSPELQIERAILRTGLSRPEIEVRIARQWTFEQKRPYANYIIDTSGTREDTIRQTIDVYHSLLPPTAS